MKWGIFFLIFSVFSACSSNVKKEQTFQGKKGADARVDANGNPLSEGDVVVEVRELEPLSYPLNFLPKNGKIEVSGMPKGMLFDEESSSLVWIPKKGQAGRVNVVVTQGDKSHKYVVTVKETDLSKGPGSKYKDSEVGYIFVHGKGDDYCKNKSGLYAYWGRALFTVAPNSDNRTEACYDGTDAVSNTAEGVAKQILDAPCGTSNKCIVITHSMGGLMMEYMMTHTRPSKASDVEPDLFKNSDLFQKAKDKVLFVISLASAAGGSKVADIVINPDEQSRIQEVIGDASRALKKDDQSTFNLQVKYASNIVAPMNEDPEVPFFMIPGFSDKQLSSTNAVLDFFDFSSDPDPKIFNGERELSLLDQVTHPNSRGDGLVSFRSSCGIKSDEVDEGPGYSAPLDRQFSYCYEEPKKPNHYVWFLSNLNHYNLSLASDGCDVDGFSCEIYMPDTSKSTYVKDTAYHGLSAMEVIHSLLN